MRISAVVVFERPELELMPSLGDVFVSANVALCAAQTSLFAAAVFFFYDVAVFVLFNFAANAFFHVVSCVAFIDLICKIVLCVGIAEVAARCAYCGAPAVKLVACILRACVKSIGYARASRVGAFRIAVVSKSIFPKSLQVCSCPPDTAAILTGISQVFPSAAVAVIYIVP